MSDGVKWLDFNKDDVKEEEEDEEDKEHKKRKCGWINYIFVKQTEITCLSIHQLF